MRGDPGGTGRRYLLDGEPVDLDELIEANQEGLDPEEIAALRALRPGDAVTFGGGAWATWTVECLPAEEATC